MSAGIGARLRVAADVGVAVQPASQCRIGAGELAGQRVVGTRVVVVEPGERVGALPGVALVGRQRALLVAHRAIGGVELGGHYPGRWSRHSR